MSIFSRRQPEESGAEKHPANDDTAAQGRSLTQTLDAASADDAMHVQDEPQEEAAFAVRQSALLEHDTLIGGVSDFANEIEAIGEVVASLKGRLPDMRQRAERVRQEATAHGETANQLSEFRNRNLELEERVTRQAETITDLEAAALAAERVQDTLQTDLLTLQSELDKERQAVVQLTKQDQALSGEFELHRVRMSKLEADQARQTMENARLNEGRVAMEKRLSQVQSDLSKAQCTLAERELQLEKVNESERVLVAEQKRGVEERASLKREITMVQADLVEAGVRIERLKAENDTYVKRLASEQYSMSKDRMALLSEFENVRQQSDATHRDLLASRDEIEALRQERDEHRQRLGDLEGVVASRRDELRSANNSISEISLKYAADMLSLDQLRDENRELRSRIEGLQSESKRLYDYQAKYKAAENRARELEARLAEHIKATGAADAGTGTVEEADPALQANGADGEMDENVTKH